MQHHPHLLSKLEASTLLSAHDTGPVSLPQLLAEAGGAASFLLNAKPRSSASGDVISPLSPAARRLLVPWLVATRAAVHVPPSMTGPRFGPGLWFGHGPTAARVVVSTQ